MHRQCSSCSQSQGQRIRHHQPRERGGAITPVPATVNVRSVPCGALPKTALLGHPPAPRWPAGRVTASRAPCVPFSRARDTLAPTRCALRPRHGAVPARPSSCARLHAGSNNPSATLPFLVSPGFARPSPGESVIHSLPLRLWKTCSKQAVGNRSSQSGGTVCEC